MIIFRHIFLVLLNIFPATSISTRFLFEMFVSFFGLGKLKSKYLFFSCMIVAVVLVLLHIPKFFLGYSLDSFTNIIRFSSVLVALFYLRVGFSEIFTLLTSLLLLNFCVSLTLVADLEIGRTISNVLHVKSPDLTYGRVSGVFHNVAVNAYFSYISCIYFFCSFLFDFRRKISVSMAVIAFACVVMAQSKTGLVLLIPSLVVLYFFICKISVSSFLKISFALVALSTLLSYYFDDIASSFYFISKLSSIIASGEASSLSARFDLWNGFLSLQVNSLSAILFGLDKTVMASVSNTFDSDFIWILVNYGVLGFIVYLVMVLSLCRSATDPSAKIFRICCLFSIPFSFLIGVISQPQAALIFWMLFVNVRRKN